ncbi:MAG: DUF3611 family protein [Deltaproteobacteria bacterium]|jgi:hypothetical protein|nr:DUF3611 family protein [Deltaproteobacteria bacterium]
MSKEQKAPWQRANPESLGRQVSRLGWMGFWIQVVLVIIPLVLLLYVVFISGPDSAQRKGIDLSDYLSYGSLVVMLFTIFWFWRYTRLGGRIVDPELRPSQSSVLRTVWIGLGASAAGILFSMILLINAVLRMLFILLATPQTGIPISATGADPAGTLSAFDAVSLTSLVFILTAELIVLAFSLWLLFRVTRSAAGSDEAV